MKHISCDFCDRLITEAYQAARITFTRWDQAGQTLSEGTYDVCGACESELRGRLKRPSTIPQVLGPDRQTPGRLPIDIEPGRPQGKPWTPPQPRKPA